MKKILVVEDDAISARMLRDFLDAHGYRTSLAMTGAEGLTRFEAEQPDLMIVDVALPMKNGFELCFDVKRTEHGKRMPLLLMSAVYRDGDHADRYARDDLHAQGWLSKPFDLSTLLERVEQLIGSA
jgi:DNA-binding response OmpR family regulator